MKKLLPGSLIVILTVLFFACQKEKSFEVGGNPAQGSLQADGGGLCLPKTVNGAYIAGTALNPANNTIDIQVDVAQTGTYTIKSDTINGYHFVGTGSFSSTGIQSVTLKGSGTPLVSGNNVFTIFFDSTACDITVQVLPAGAGGAAVFTLAGAGGACTSANPSGIYIVGTVLNNTNSVSLSVNVTTIGTYTITTTAVQGMTFSGSGTFSATGLQHITLIGNGTPVAPAGSISIPVTAGGGTCNFTINLLATAPPPDYFPRTTNSNWSYEFDNVATDSLHEKVIAATHTVAANTYNIFMGTDDVAFGYDSAGYYRKSGNDYYRYVNLADYIGFDDDQFAEFIFLKDNQAQGATWTTPGFTGNISGTSYMVRMKYTILQKDVPFSLTTSLGTVNYQNVIAVEEKYEAFAGGTWQDLTSQIGKYVDYYARNIGWIADHFFDAPGTSTTPTSIFQLRRYAVY